MALVIKDRIKETSTTSGTGTLTLDGASTGFASFSEIGSGNTTYYVITNSTDWEVGIGTVGTGTLSRDTILASSNAGSAVNWTSAIKDVFCTYPAEKAVYEQSGGLVEVPSLNINSSTTVDGVLDEDTLVSDSATKLATQQSIKAYVDGQSYVTDGDKGDVVVSSSGSVWTVESAAGNFDIAASLTVDTDTLHVDSTNNRVGIGTTSPSYQLSVGADDKGIYSDVDGMYVVQNTSNLDVLSLQSKGIVEYRSDDQNNTAQTAHIFYTDGSEAARIDSSGKLLVGTTVSDSKVNIETTEQFDPTASKATNAISIIQSGGTQGNGNYSTGITFSKINSARPGAAIVSKQTDSDVDRLGLAFLTHSSATSSETLSEAAVLDHAGNFFVGKSSIGIGTAGVEARASGALFSTVSGSQCAELNRLTSDGNIVRFWQDTSVEGVISVSGTTVSYTGGHLSRWTQIDSDNGSLLKGTVMTNLDEMCVWKQAVFTTQEVISSAVEAVEAVAEIPEELDDEGNIIQEYVPAVEAREAQDAVYKDVEQKQTYSGSAADGDVIDFDFEGQTYSATVVFEDNEQLNKNAVSSVEGDPNVSGVFVNYDEDGDINLAMTGDMVIRIAQGTTVARGDLLMSAGDGTAKPQGDDIVRSKTIAKVTSTNITKTYDDGSYLVPCVLMAC